MLSKCKQLFLGIGILCLLPISGMAMDVKVIGDTLILSGGVVSDDYAKVTDVFSKNPKINTAILRHSHGGDAWAGYRIGELFRDKNITTAVSGYCISSCSRMYLGGKKRVFTNDYPVSKTYIAFHGHYENGQLSSESVYKFGLYHWILKYSDGKADEALVKRWTTLQKANGIAAFFSPELSASVGSSVFICEGTENVRPLGCEKLPTNAIERGVATHLEYIASPDQELLPEKIRAKQFQSSGFALVTDLDRVPLESRVGMDNYKRFLMQDSPRAFAIALTKQHWAFNSGINNANEVALQRCSERANQACVLYAVDENVVYKP